MTLTTRSAALRSKVGVSAAAAAVLLLAACGSSSGSTSTGSSAPAAGGSSAAANDPIAGVKAELETLKAPVVWPAPVAPSKPLDIKGKTVWWIPIGDAVPVIHGIGEGFKQSVEAAGGTFKLCDGKFNPAEVGNCLKQAGEQNAGAVVTAFVDYAMLPNAFDALTSQGIPVLVGGVPASGNAKVGPKLGFFDPTQRVNGIYNTITKAGLATSGTKTNGLWLRLLDSTTTTNASDAGIATYKQICPSCALATVDFTTANIDKLASAVSAALVKSPDINTLFVPVDSFVPPAVQGAKTAGKNDLVVVSASGDLANLQAVKAGTQAGDFGNPVIYTGWTYGNALGQLLAGDTVTPDEKAVGRYFDSSNVSALTLTPEKYLTSDWYGDESFKAAFLAAWGIK